MPLACQPQCLTMSTLMMTSILMLRTKHALNMPKHGDHSNLHHPWLVGPHFMPGLYLLGQTAQHAHHVHQLPTCPYDTCHFTVNTPPNFISEVTTLLHTMWGLHRWSFHVHEAEVLTGKLIHIGFSSLWVKLLLGHIYSSLASVLHINHAHLIRTSHGFHCGHPH